ncbi:MAG TPA: nickel-dependent hydrogenase large subunit [Candidatus Limnocylindria bacterium]|jgi:Ni,Fe-hydrogenase III large subunit|nr:nickel-dependent hydrogenase large subunit [Candidatus Limnocylindria bacterium]
MSALAATLPHAICAELERGWPLGAYAAHDGLRYLVLGSDGVRMVHVPRGDEPCRAVSALVPAFAWDEREMADEWGVAFDALPDPRALWARGGALPDAIVASGPGVTRIVVGPVHAGIIEPGRFTFSSGGETVVHLDAQLGFSHRGLERAFAGADPLTLAPRVARICGACSASRSLAYAIALETIAGAQIPDEVELARLLLAELERIANHVFDLAVCASAAGWAPGFTTGLGLKEAAMRLAATACGHRLFFDAIVPGGVRAEILADRTALRVQVDALAARVEEFLRVLFDNASLVSRWTGTGALSFDEVRALGVLGPAHRASGGTIDVRDALPYGAYRWLPTDVALETTGDVGARCRVKAAELRTSFTFVRRALDQLGASALPAPTPLALRCGTSTSVVEGPRGAETISVAIEDGVVTRLHAIAASYRTWPAVALATMRGIVPDFPLVNKSFNLCYACADR